MKSIAQGVICAAKKKKRLIISHGRKERGQESEMDFILIDSAALQIA